MSGPEIVGAFTIVERAEMRESKSGRRWCRARARCSFPPAKDAPEGEFGPTWWINLVGFGSIAEALAEIPKGATVHAHGRLQLGRYTPKDGGPERDSWDVVVDWIPSFGGSKRKTSKHQDLAARVADPSPTEGSLPWQ